MPFVSNAQRKYFRWAEAKGILKPGTYDQWEKETPKGKKLPERLHNKKPRSKRAMLLDLAAQGNQTAQLVLEVIKSATVGRHEGYGATNSMVTAGGGLLSATNLAKPPKQAQQPTLPGQTPQAIGQTPSTLMKTGPASPTMQASPTPAGRPASGVTSSTP
jgi:hypothetical protein